MKNLLLFILLGCFPLIVSAQVTFDKGYFINNNNERIECFIYNEDWKNHPTEIKYRITEGDAEQTETIKEIKAFEIYDDVKFVRYKGKVDVSGNNANRYSEQKEPEWEEKTIFLKVLVEGSATLYYYFSKQIERFYFQINDGEIEPLIYKIYLLNREGAQVSAINAKFRRQLLVAMQCETMTMADVDKLEYKRSDLINYFKKYYQCIGEEVVISEKRKYEFNLGIKAGIARHTFAYNPTSTLSWITRGFNPRFGIETEIMLPFKKNKWAFLIEPTYRIVNKSETTTTEVVFPSTITRTYTLNYASLELQGGFRYSHYLNTESRIFANLLYVKDFDLKSTLKFGSPGANITTIELNPFGNWALGVGYNYKNKAAIELRYNTFRNTTFGFLGLQTLYNNISLSACYYLF